MIAKRSIAVGGIVGVLLGCASTQIGNPNRDYEPVELNRVYPYPSDQELRGQKTEVVLASRYTRDLPEAEVGRAMARLQRELERILGLRLLPCPEDPQIVGALGAAVHAQRMEGAA